MGWTIDLSLVRIIFASFVTVFFVIFKSFNETNANVMCIMTANFLYYHRFSKVLSLYVWVPIIRSTVSTNSIDSLDVIIRSTVKSLCHNRIDSM